jgi:DNA-binding MarR family transcriptional regulator
MDTRQIREFRRSLRQFTRVTSLHLKSCCTEVTLAQCLVLLEVDEQDRLTVGQLAFRLRLDDSTLSRTIDGLVRRGLLERTRDDGDRRVVWIRLTREGVIACEAIHKQNDALYRGILDRIPPSRRATVIRSFGVLVQAFVDSESESAADAACAGARESASP